MSAERTQINALVKDLRSLSDQLDMLSARMTEQKLKFDPLNNELHKLDAIRDTLIDQKHLAEKQSSEAINVLTQITSDRDILTQHVQNEVSLLLAITDYLQNFE